MKCVKIRFLSQWRSKAAYNNLYLIRLSFNEVRKGPVLYLEFLLNKDFIQLLFNEE